MILDLRARKYTSTMTHYSLDVDETFWHKIKLLKPENAHRRISVCLVSSLTRCDMTKEENMLLYVCSETSKSNLTKLNISPMISPITFKLILRFQLDDL